MLHWNAVARMQILGARHLHQLNRDPQQWELKLQVRNSDQQHVWALSIGFYVAILCLLFQFGQGRNRQSKQLKLPFSDLALMVT